MSFDSISAAFLHNPVGQGPFCHCPSLAPFDGGLACAWYAYPEVEHEHGQLMLALRGSDGWSKVWACELGESTSLGNPCLAQDAITGDLVLWFVALRGSYWTHAQVLMARSADAGRSWSRPQALEAPLGTMVRHPPIVLRDRYVLPAYDERRRCMRLFLAPRLGGPWHDQGPILPNCIQAAAVVCASRLLLLCRPAEGANRVLIASSDDGGTSWTPPEPTSLRCPLSGIAAIAYRDGLLLAHNHTDAHRRTPLSLSVGDTGGRWWRPPVHVDQVPLEISYPSMTLDAGGTLHLAYTYNRRMIKHLELRSDDPTRP